MNFLSFEYVLALSQAETIRQAAERLYISPQALSEHLGKLERELDAPLFRRTTPLTLTAAGERFIQCAQTCLEARQQLEAQLAALRERREDRVTLGVPTGMPPPLLIPFVTYVRRACPELTLSIVELPTRTGALAELPDHVDIAMGAFPEGNRLRHIPILSSRRFVVAAHRELLRRVLGEAETARLEEAAAGDQPVEVARFRACPFIRKRPGSVIRANEDRIFRAAGFEARGRTETGDLELSVRLTLLGEAVLYLPEPMARASFLFPSVPGETSPVLLCPVRAEGELWALTAAHSVHKTLSRGTERLVEAAKRYYGSTLGSGETIG